MGTKPTEHPALALLRSEAKGYLTNFRTDLEVHDAAALVRYPHSHGFAWILRPDATFLSPMSGARRANRFAAMVVGAFGADGLRYFFWNGVRVSLTRVESATSLDALIDEHETGLRSRHTAGLLADRGVA